MSIYDEVDKIFFDFKCQILSLAQQNQDLKIENASLKSLVETYKAKSDLLINLTAPIDMHLAKPLTQAEEIKIDRELKRIK